MFVPQDSRILDKLLRRVRRESHSLTGPQRHQPFTPNKKSMFVPQDSRMLNKLLRRVRRESHSLTGPQRHQSFIPKNQVGLLMPPTIYP